MSQDQPDVRRTPDLPKQYERFAPFPRLFRAFRNVWLTLWQKGGVTLRRLEFERMNLLGAVLVALLAVSAVACGDTSSGSATAGGSGPVDEEPPATVMDERTDPPALPAGRLPQTCEESSVPFFDGRPFARQEAVVMGASDELRCVWLGSRTAGGGGITVRRTKPHKDARSFFKQSLAASTKSADTGGEGNFDFTRILNDNAFIAGGWVAASRRFLVQIEVLAGERQCTAASDGPADEPPPETFHEQLHALAEKYCGLE